MDTFDPQFSKSEVEMNIINKVLSALDKEGYYLPGDIIELKNYNKTNLSTKIPAV